MKQIATMAVGSVLPANPEFNGFVSETQNAIISGGISLDESDVTQLGKSMANYVGNADYYACTGTANTYTLSRIGPFKNSTTYFTGMKIRFRPNINNTGASTVNVVGIGIKNLKKTDGITDFVNGEISTLYDYEFVYDGTSFSLKSNGFLEGNFVSPDLFKTNLFDNGGMQIYQRASPHTLVKDVYGFGVDRWAGMVTGTAVNAGTLRQATASTLNNSGYSALFQGVTLTGTGVVYFRQRRASQTAVMLKNQNVSIQFNVYHDVGSPVNYTIYVRKANALNNFTTTTNIANSGAISINTATDTKIEYKNVALGDCSNGLEIEVKIECGAITTKNFEFANAKLEIGTSASNFINKDYNEDLLNCKFYYKELVIGKGGAPIDGSAGGYGYGTILEEYIAINMAKAPIVVDGLSGSVGTATVYLSGGTPPTTTLILPHDAGGNDKANITVNTTISYITITYYLGDAYRTSAIVYGMRFNGLVKLNSEL